MELELENMTNKELRQKCVEYGLPNVPITKTSRKLMERRLHAVMSPTSSKTSKTARRETVHATKISTVSSGQTMLDKSSSNVIKTQTPDNRPSRRTVIGMEKLVSTTTNIENDVDSAPIHSNVMPKRVIIHEKPQSSIQEKPTTKNSLYPQLPTSETSPQPLQLSKTEVLTTSYIQEPKTSPNAHVSTTYASAEEMDSNDSFNVKLSPQKVSERNIFKGYGNPSTSKPINSLNYGQSVPMSKPSSVKYGTSLSRSSLNFTQTQQNRYSNFGTNQYKYGKKLNKENIIDDDDDDDDEEEDEIVVIDDSPLGKDIQTPYLSEFARNLESLKATPLSVKSTFASGYDYSTSAPANLRSREANRRNTVNIEPRRSLQKCSKKDDVTFHDLFMALEEKYHIKQSCFIIFVFILGTLLYYLFIHHI